MTWGQGSDLLTGDAADDDGAGAVLDALDLLVLAGGQVPDPVGDHDLSHAVGAVETGERVDPVRHAAVASGAQDSPQFVEDQDVLTPVGAAGCGQGLGGLHPPVRLGPCGDHHGGQVVRVAGLMLEVSILTAGADRSERSTGRENTLP
jgi:hypothetical protein